MAFLLPGKEGAHKEELSWQYPLECGCSILKFVNIYMHPPAQIVQSHGNRFASICWWHSTLSDDEWLARLYSRYFGQDITRHDWMINSQLKLNPTKIEDLYLNHEGMGLGIQYQPSTRHHWSQHWVCGAWGMTLDASLSMGTQVVMTARSPFYHLCLIRESLVSAPCENMQGAEIRDRRTVQQWAVWFKLLWAI